MSFGITEHLGFTLGDFFFFFLNLEFSHAGSVWGLGSQFCVGIYHRGITHYSQLVLFFRVLLPNYPNLSLSKMPLGDAPSLSTFDYFVIRGKYLAQTCSGPALTKAHGRNLTHCDFSVTIPAIKSSSYTGLCIDVSSGSSWSRGSLCLEILDR